MDARGIPAVGARSCRPLWLFCAIPARWRRRSPGGGTDPDGGLYTVKITIPELSLVVLIGPSGSGKSTFARERFKATEILSSDFCRGLVSDDENDQSATNEAFDLLHYIAR